MLKGKYRILNIIEEITKSHSKREVMAMVRKIDRDENLFKMIMEVYFDEKNPVAACKAAWILRHAADRHPAMIRPYLKDLVKYLRNENHHVAVKRNGLGILQSIDIPESLFGPLSDLCFNFMNSNKEPVAVKVYSMIILDKIGNQIPEIRHELKLILQDLLPYGSSGFIARARKILAK